jgi:hypothetical protein
MEIVDKTLECNQFNASNGGKKMISRIWHGWTTPENADLYAALLREEICVGIPDRHITGFKSIQLLRSEV